MINKDLYKTLLDSMNPVKIYNNIHKHTSIGCSAHYHEQNDGYPPLPDRSCKDTFNFSRVHVAQPLVCHVVIRVRTLN